MLPSSTDLNYFIVVTQHKNLTHAAETIGITQPSLSLSMQRLEKAMGTPLFIRSKKGVNLTKAGQQILINAKKLLQSWEEVRADALSVTEEIKGEITVGCHPSVGLYSLSQFLSDALSDYEDLSISLKHGLSRTITESVVQMSTDVGIVVNPVKHPDLVLQKLGDDEVSFYVGPGKKPTQNFKTGTAVLICDPVLYQTQDLTKKLKRKGIKYSRLLPSSNLEVVSHLTLTGAGIGIIPGRVAKFMGEGKLKKVPNAPSYKDEIYVAYRIENKNVKAIRYIVDKIKESFKN